MLLCLLFFLLNFHDGEEYGGYSGSNSDRPDLKQWQKVLRPNPLWMYVSVFNFNSKNPWSSKKKKKKVKRGQLWKTFKAKFHFCATLRKVRQDYDYNNNILFLSDHKIHKNFDVIEWTMGIRIKKLSITNYIFSLFICSTPQ